MTARAAIWSGEEGFSIRDIDIPSLAPGELLVEVELATICGSDLHTVHGDRPAPVPSVLGHEAVGRVVATGGGTTAANGDRIVLTIGTACGECQRCRRGVPQKCERVRKYGHEKIRDVWSLNGAFATHVHLLPGTGTVRVPDRAPAALLAPAGCATATVTCAARRVALSPDDAVVVIGCGMLGLTAVTYARHLGVRNVLACDVDDRRRDLAVAMGATATCGPNDLKSAAAEHGADVVFELAGHHDAVRAALRVVDVAGRVALVGSVSPGPPVSLDPNAFVRNLNTVVGSHNYAHRDLITAVAFLTSTNARLTELVSPPSALADIDAAFALAASGQFPRGSVAP